LRRMSKRRLSGSSTLHTALARLAAMKSSSVPRCRATTPLWFRVWDLGFRV